jgi:hypothetical protein
MVARTYRALNHLTDLGGRGFSGKPEPNNAYPVRC